MNSITNNLLTRDQAIIVIANYWTDMMMLDEMKDKFYKSLVALLKKDNPDKFVLFVDNNSPSVDLSEALENAGIDSIQKVFPEKVWMYIDRYEEERHAELYEISVKWYDQLTVLS